MGAATCSTCGGNLVRRKHHRVIRGIATIGLAVSGLAVVFSFIMIAFAIDLMGETLMDGFAAPHLEPLRVAGVPEEVLQKTRRAEPLTAAETEGLTQRQQRLIEEAREIIDVMSAAVDEAAEAARINSIITAVAAAAAGGLCLFLATRKGELRCEACGKPP